MIEFLPWSFRLHLLLSHDLDAVCKEIIMKLNVDRLLILAQSGTSYRLNVEESMLVYIENEGLRFNTVNISYTPTYSLWTNIPLSN